MSTELSRYMKRSGRSSTAWIRRELRFAIYFRDGFDCQLCHCMFPPAYDGLYLTLDHVKPRIQGGTHESENLLTVCFPCNSSRAVFSIHGAERRRIWRQTRKPLDREAGKVYAKLRDNCARLGLIHPFTLREVPRNPLPLQGMTREQVANMLLDFDGDEQAQAAE